MVVVMRRVCTIWGGNLEWYFLVLGEMYVVVGIRYKIVLKILGLGGIGCGDCCGGDVY